jgi:hypothetical protein
LRACVKRAEQDERDDERHGGPKLCQRCEEDCAREFFMCEGDLILVRFGKLRRLL